MTDEPYDPDLQRRLAAKGLASGAAVEVARALYSASAGQGMSWGIITGNGPPGAGAQLSELTVENDPWRWAPSWSGWVLARHMSWEEGAILTHPQLYNALHYELDVVEGMNASLNSSATFGLAHPPTVSVINPITAEAAGEGLVYMVQMEPDYAMTGVPEVDLDLNLLLTGFTDLGEFELDDITTGADGQMYLDVGSRILYGPRNQGHWNALSTLPPAS